jgi:hypothetical protein
MITNPYARSRLLVLAARILLLILVVGFFVFG